MSITRLPAALLHLKLEAEDGSGVGLSSLSTEITKRSVALGRAFKYTVYQSTFAGLGKSRFFLSPSASQPCFLYFGFIGTSLSSCRPVSGWQVPRQSLRLVPCHMSEPALGTTLICKLNGIPLPCPKAHEGKGKKCFEENLL